MLCLSISSYRASGWENLSFFYWSLATSCLNQIFFTINVIICRDLGAEEPSSPGKNKRFAAPGDSSFSQLLPTICSTSHVHSSDPLDIPVSFVTWCQGPKKDFQEEKRMVTLWGTGSTGYTSTSACLSVAQTNHRLFFHFPFSPLIFNYPTCCRATSDKVVEFNFLCHLGQWGFSKRTWVHVPGGRRTVWSQVFHVSEKSLSCWVLELHRRYLGTAHVCLNFTHYNTHLFGDYRQGTEFIWEIKSSPRTFNQTLIWDN